MLVDDEAQAVRGDRAGRVVAGPEVGEAFRAQEAVGEEFRHVDVLGGDREVPEQRCPKVEVDEVCLAGELAQVRAVLGVELLPRWRCRLPAAPAPAFAVVLRLPFAARRARSSSTVLGMTCFTSSR